ncbi:hypothetical protein HV461_11775 [Bacillus sporothermodurans]|nr:hypothetical protein [Heyndrickxia sporothermodurans]MBL5771888.1 hypothetical protein [Heyndrickxia sporothermodurans]MBL5811319.1 hypothetical protein [Heyndrickxia sporothermodurans]MBL5850786.1 hypothetical protein [Heyndrickxia sporothermodurans]MBL5867590.1 hypothetical protein [Heyndrickxia sporothermodurans]
MFGKKRSGSMWKANVSLWVRKEEKRSDEEVKRKSMGPKRREAVRWLHNHCI